MLKIPTVKGVDGAKPSLLKVVLRSVFVSIVSMVVAMAAQHVLKMVEGREDVSSSSKYRRVALDCLEPSFKSTDGLALDRLGGMQSTKERIRSTVIRALQYPKVFFDAQHPGLCHAQRLLFCGPPGTGKTMLAKAIAVDAGVNFMNVTLSTLEDKYFGETPKIMRAVWEVAKEKAPVVLFFDEIDGIMRTRRDDDQGCVYGMKTEFLQLCDGLTSGDAVVLIGCTNNERALDPALRRRFPSVFHMALPDYEERKSILSTITRSEKRVNQRILDTVAQLTDGLSGSGLQDLYNAASVARMQRSLRGVVLTSNSTAKDVGARLKPLRKEDWMDALLQKMSRTLEAEKTAEYQPPDEDEALPPE